MMNGLMRRDEFGDGLFPMMFNLFDEDFGFDAFDKMLGDINPTRLAGKERIGYPMNVVRITDKDGRLKAYRLEYALAGFDRNDISLTVKGDILKLVAEHGEGPKEVTDQADGKPADNTEAKPVEEDIEHVEYKGISCKRMSVSYRLTENADAKMISSRYVNGMLLVTIPVKAKKDDSRSISIG